MSTTTVRIPEEKRDLLKIVASVEKRDIKEILTDENFDAKEDLNLSALYIFIFNKLNEKIENN